MTNTLRLSAIALVATLTAAGSCLAADPNGSTPTGPRPPRDAGPASTVPLPSPQPGPTGFGIQRDLPPPQPPSDLTAREAEMDRIIGVLLGADDFKSPAGWCDGMIACCNTAWVQGCDFVQFDVDCVAAGGTIQIHTLSDGSTQYECHAI